jgi:hypothetical protein
LNDTKTRTTPKGAKPPAPATFPRRFVFHGNAVAAGMILTRINREPNTRMIAVEGQSSLPVIGGFSTSVVPNSHPDFAQIFAYTGATTQAEGVLNGNTAITTVSASLNNLRIVNRPSPGESADLSDVVFTAGELSLSLRSTHRRGQPKIEFVDPPKAAGLSLANLPITLTFRQEFLKLSRMQDLEDKFRSSKAFFADTRDAFMRTDPDKPPAFGQKIPRMNNGYAVCSFVKSIQWGDQTINGHVLTKVGFGTIYFGEMLVNDNNKRITFVRVQLGSDDEGQGGFVEVDPNGDWVPPQN